MDPSFRWFLPEHYNRASTLWSEIWYMHQRYEPHDPKIECMTFSDASLINANDMDKNTRCVQDSSVSDVELAKLYSSRNREKVPWMLNDKVYSQGLQGLHEEIEDFYQFMLPTANEHAMRLEVVERMSNIILEVYPCSKVEVYGSFRTGLYLPTSDIDLVVIETKNVSFRLLEQALLQKNIAKASSIKVLDKASVPIVKLVDAQTEVKIDISFNMSNGVKSADLIKEYIKTFPVLPKLVFVLKQFLLQRNLNEVFQGGISSYSVILLTISFLQHKMLIRKIINGTENEDKINENQKIKTEHNLGKLLIQFLEFYGHLFNYQTTGISIRNGGSYFQKKDFKTSDGTRPQYLCIEDPLLPGNDISKSSFGAVTVKEAFDSAFYNLSEAVRPYSDNVDELSILRRIIWVADKTIKYREWINDSFPLQPVCHLERGDSPELINVPYKKDEKSNKSPDVFLPENETSSSYPSDRHSSCASVGSSSSASSMISDTDSDLADRLIAKRETTSETETGSSKIPK